MSNQVNAELQTKTQQLLDGPLKHVRAAALAAALLPLASIAASAQTPNPNCASGGTCGVVYTDNNGNGIYDTGDTPIVGVAVTACDSGGCLTPVTTDTSGGYSFPVGALTGDFTISIVTPTGTQPSPLGVDNQGVSNGSGFSVASSTSNPNVVLGSSSINFGFTPAPSAAPGTGTPGYWKNHPGAWPVSSITVGGVTYTEAQAIAWLNKTGKDKRVTMFQSLVSAMLSVDEGNNATCISTAISQGNAWMALYPLAPDGSAGTPVAGGSAAWATGQPIQSTLDAYDNGLLCAPHRQ